MNAYGMGRREREREDERMRDVDVIQFHLLAWIPIPPSRHGGGPL